MLFQVHLLQFTAYGIFRQAHVYQDLNTEKKKKESIVIQQVN